MAFIVALSSQSAQAAAITALPKDQSQGTIEQVFAFRDALPTGVSISEKARIFVNFPRWGGNVPFTVGELREGKAVPYPDLALNQADLSERAIALRHRIQVAAGQWAEIQRLAIRRESNTVRSNGKWLAASIGVANSHYLTFNSRLTEQQLCEAVKDSGEKGPSDGLEADSEGAIYTGDYEDNSIRKRLPDGSWQTVVHDPRILWPDTLSVGTDGYLYFTANQLHRQAGFHGGKDLREKPYSLLRVKINATPVQTR